jgi:hypothetical protein
MVQGLPRYVGIYVHVAEEEVGRAKRKRRHEWDVRMRTPADPEDPKDALCPECGVLGTLTDTYRPEDI